MKSTLFHRYRTFLAGLAATAVAAPLAFAGTEEAGKETKAIVAPEPETKVHFLLNLEIANEYVTPRGMIVRDKGVTIQPLALMLTNLYKGDGFLNDVTMVLGAWNDFGTSGVSKHAPFGSNPKTYWSEIDPIAGLSFTFLKDFKLDVTYTSFVEQVLDIETSHHLETKLSYDDSKILGAFALHPYVSYWQELQGKATDADVPYAVFGPSPKSGNHPDPGSSFYFDIGVSPGYTFPCGVKIEAPCRIMLPDDRFYGEYYKSSSTIGLYELGLKATAPLNFMPKGYGHWSAHVGGKYINFVDDNLYELNTFNAPGKATRDTWQVYGGISVFF
jgi:hypothetical protein